MDDPEQGEGGRRVRRPWWIPHFLGPIPDVEARHLTILGIVSLALLFEEYDLAMLTSALHRIAADLQIADDALANYLGIIRLGALPALFVIPFADRVGRRRIFLISLVATAAFTGLTGLSQSAAQFVACQLLTRTFFIAGSSVAVVMVTEEFPTDHRGWGIGMLSALGAAGHGTAALLYAQVDLLPYGWRSLYWIGALPILLLPYFRARLPDSERFKQHRDRLKATEGKVSIISAWSRPLGLLFRTYPYRVLGITVVGAASSIGMISAFQFTGLFTQTVHGWSPGHFSTMVVVGGALGITGSMVAGALGDRVGRRRVGCALLAVYPAFVGLFYLGPAETLEVSWIGLVFCSAGGRMIIRAFASELFPTSQRATAIGWWGMVDAAGAAVGLFMLGMLSSEIESIRRVAPMLALAVAVSGVVLMAFPETNKRDLDSISAPEVTAN